MNHLLITKFFSLLELNVLKTVGQTKQANWRHPPSALGLCQK